MDINEVIANTIVGILVIVIPLLAGYLTRLLVQLIRNTQTQADDRLAAIAVAWAEDQINKGGKLEAATARLVEMSRGRISSKDAETMVAATYTNMQAEWDALKKK